MILRLIAILIFLGTLPTHGQESLDQLILEFDQFQDIVKEHHPLAVAADLQVEGGEATQQSARGAFDPTAYAGFQTKEFKGVDYYDIGTAGLKIPTWYGLEIQAGFDENSGDFLNPERTTPSDGLTHAGLSLTLGQGLFIDKRRAELQKAQIYLSVSDQERRQMLNELLFESGKAYWSWFEAYNDLLIYQEALEVASIRLEAVRQSVEFGDAPPIDTLEAGIQVQNRQLLLQQGELDFKNATEFLSIFIWSDGRIPLELDESAIPLSFDFAVEQVKQRNQWKVLDSVVAIHPKILAFSGKIEQMKIQRRLKREMLKPIINLKYNALAGSQLSGLSEDLGDQNYTFGVQFQMPILLRKERGELKMTDVRISQAQNELSFGKEKLGFQVVASRNRIETTREQVDLFSQTVLDSEGLLEGERQKFDAGESSLFLVNARELRYINARVKLVGLVTKNRKAQLETEFYSGSLFLN